MQTIPQPTIKAKYATVYDEPATITQVNEILYVVFEDRIERFAVEMAPFTTVLGDVSISDVQAMYDRIAGGPAMIACQRGQEVR